MNKRESEKVLKWAVRWLSQFHGTNTHAPGSKCPGIADECFYRWQLPSQIGVLSITLFPDAMENLFCQWSDPRAARNNVVPNDGINPYSGKWNYHGEGKCAAADIEQFEYHLQAAAPFLYVL